MIHIAGNLWNSYCDYTNKIDTKETAADRTILDEVISVETCRNASLLFFGLFAAFNIRVMLDL